MADCIFCKIAAKQIPSKIVAENDQVIAFLDVNPVSEYHTLVVPKQHSLGVFDIAPELLRRTIETAQEVANKMKAEQGINGVNILNCSGAQSGQSVGHFHVHVIPRRDGDAATVLPKIDALLKQK